LSDSKPHSPEDSATADEPLEVDDALKALFVEALELQDQRKKSDDKEDLDALIAENFGSSDEPEHFSDEDPDLALPDLPDDEMNLGGTGVDPEVVERLESEIEILKQQKKTLHEQMAQRADRYESAEARVNQLEQQLVGAARQGQSLARDFENFRTRTDREKETQKKLAAEKVLRGFLTVYDNLSRALDHAENRDGPLGQGVAMTLDQFLSTLRGSGASLAPAEIGTPFDPTYQEAMQQVFSDDIPEGSIVHVLQEGFLLGDRLLRAAMVCVSQGPEPGKTGAKKKSAPAKKPKAPAKKAKAPAKTASSKRNPSAGKGRKKKKPSTAAASRSKKKGSSAAKEGSSE